MDPSIRAVPFALLSLLTPSPSQELPLVTGVELQPFAAATARLCDALDHLGAPLAAEARRALQDAFDAGDPARALRTAQEMLDPLALVMVHVDPESRVKVAEGPAPKQLLQHGWRTFLVKVHNEAPVTAVLAATSPNAAPLFKQSQDSPEPEPSIPVGDLPNRFLDLSMFDRQPLRRRLSGLALEYRIVQIYSRDAGPREASLAFHVGQGTQDLGFRNALPILFDCRPAVAVTLRVRDFDGRPTTASFEIRDQLGRVYPSPGRRLAPDFFFHPQVYREDGETVLLPSGDFDVTVGRGPEYLVATRRIVVPDRERHEEEFALERWIHTAALGWRSGDHHVHAAGCAHYESPTEGVDPADMARHLRGEDVGVGCVLSWGPCWYHQKQFFDGAVHPLSTDDHVMRYDVEVSGFPSSQ